MITVESDQTTAVRVYLGEYSVYAVTAEPGATQHSLQLID